MTSVFLFGGEVGERVKLARRQKVGLLSVDGVECLPVPAQDAGKRQNSGKRETGLEWPTRQRSRNRASELVPSWPGW